MRFLIVCAAAVMAVSSQAGAAAPAQAPAPEASKGCENNDTHPLSDYLDLADRVQNLELPMFKQVPKDVTIVNEDLVYEVPTNAISRILPTAKSESLTNIMSNIPVPSPCRVLTPDGQWWIVYRLREGLLTYIPEGHLRRPASKPPAPAAK